ncbi:LacI family DNA-binding transcriptional regulator [Microlunatus panaciterrae]|uniref:LacI family transcriptional regulator n=1 Tax=Microlunatus panaciterrae TaxID=400768 RepID=A0ABS2RLW1_9ACTN|nr:LacI family transcriptional regulator [Microlunatus panaciterrae]
MEGRNEASPGEEPADPPPPAGAATIYDVAKAAGVAASTVSRALSRPGRVSFKTAERIREAAEELGYRAGSIRRTVPAGRSRMLAMVVADITNPAFFGMIRGAERTAKSAGYTLLVVETQESEEAEHETLTRLLPFVDGVMLTSSRMPDSAIRGAAKQRPLVVLNRVVGQVPSVMSDNVKAAKRAAEHLGELGHRSICYLAGPDASWADGMRWRGLREAGEELSIQVRRLGPCQPTLRGGGALAEQWLERPTSAVLAYNDLVAIGFMRAVTEAGCSIPADVSVIGFDNILDSALVTPRLTTLAAPLVSLGEAAVSHLLARARDGQPENYQPILMPARLVVRESTASYRGR